MKKLIAMSGLISIVFVIGFFLGNTISPVEAQTGGNTTDVRVWMFKPPVDASGVDRTFSSIATLVTTVGTNFPVCWVNPNSKTVGTKSVEDTNFQIAHRRYRVEGGPKETSEVLLYDKWRPSLNSAGTVIPREYCATSTGVSETGHYIYEVQMCKVPYISDAESCSPWIESIRTNSSQFGGGTLDGRPTGWWIYAFAPSNVVETVRPKKVEKFEVI